MCMTSETLLYQNEATNKNNFWSLYNKNNLACQIPCFLAKEGPDFELGIPTGFPTIDKAIGGGLKRGITVIGARSSLGKSTFCMQVAANISVTGRTVLYFSSEMSQNQCLAKLHSRNSYLLYGKSQYANQAMEFLTSKEENRINFNCAEIQAVTEAVQKEALNFYFFENTGDMILSIDTVVNTVKNACASGINPVVVIDYIQLLQLSEEQENMNENQALSYAMSQLRKLANDYGVIVVVITAFNRASKGKAKIDSGLSSSGLEYGADVYFGLELRETDDRQSEEERMAKPVRDIDLVILKQRMGVTGMPYHLQHHTHYDYFEEADTSQNKRVAKPLFYTLSREPEGSSHVGSNEKLNGGVNDERRIRDDF